ncbi:MAG: EamA family transporter [archaeon]
MNELIIVLIIIFATFVSAIGSLFLKLGTKTLSLNFIKLLKNNKLILGIFLFGVSMLFYIWGVSMAKLSFIYPITSLTYIWISLLSIKYLNEKMNVYKWFGIAIIIVGVFLITV